MSAHETTISVLAEHRWIPRHGDWGICACNQGKGYMEPEERHLAHQARMLAKAGLLLGTQEWGVRITDDRGYSMYRGRMSRAMAYAYRSRVGPDLAAEIVTRRTAATEWILEEEN